VDQKLEVVIIAVTDVDRAKEFYQRRADESKAAIAGQVLGW
jgi:catechol 2,3-dioxygenase-like lactoylglutathione lyase family enzyme